VFVSTRIPFVNAAHAILTPHLNLYGVLSNGRPACAECQGKISECEFKQGWMYHLSLSNQQLHKYYKAFRPLMLRSIQAAMVETPATMSR
jgi:hypothetical protein